MSIWTECEECGDKIAAIGADPYDKSVFFKVETLDGSEVGHYCSAEHARTGIEGWVAAMNVPEDVDA